MQSLYYNSSTPVKLNALTDSNGNLVTNATVTYTITDVNATVINSGSLTGGTGGNYSAMVTPTLTLEALYDINVTAIYNGAQELFVMHCICVLDDGNDSCQ